MRVQCAGVRRGLEGTGPDHDVVARRHRLLGQPTFFLTGTDEHGQKIERSAAAAACSQVKPPRTRARPAAPLARPSSGFPAARRSRRHSSSRSGSAHQGKSTVSRSPTRLWPSHTVRAGSR